MFLDNLRLKYYIRINIKPYKTSYILVIKGKNTLRDVWCDWFNVLVLLQTPE